MKDIREARYLATFGKRLAQLRRKRGLTQSQLAERVHVTPLNIGYIEQGRYFTKITTMHDIAQAFSITVMELFRGL